MGLSDHDFWELHFLEFKALMERWQDRERRDDLRCAYLMAAMGAKDADQCFPSLIKAPKSDADATSLTDARTKEWLKFAFARAKKPE